LNEIKDNTFSSTTGMTGVMTGSCNVITLNINRIVQNYFSFFPSDCNINCFLSDKSNGYPFLKKWLTEILERVYKYHIAYKTMLYDLEDKGMLAASNAGYIYLKKLYSTIGIIGYCEAAKFLGIEVSKIS
jgi:ribonucleoside-triphosphate reductase